MWRVVKNKDPSRGGFQDRDAGRTNTGNDFGPDFAVDYARYSDPPDLAADAKLKSEIKDKIEKIMTNISRPIDIRVRNGFVFLKGELPDSVIRQKIISETASVAGVRDVIMTKN